jgi:amino acid permease
LYHPHNPNDSNDSSDGNPNDVYDSNDPQDLNSLRFTSTISLFFVFYMVVVIVAYATFPVAILNPCQDFIPASNCAGEQHLFVADTGTLHVLSIYIFGYTCHQNIFSLCNELKDNTQKRVNTVISTAIGSAFVVYVAIACAGYFAYGSSVSPDIISSYPQNALMAVSRVFIALLCAFSYPLQCHPCRTSINQTLFKTPTISHCVHVVMTLVLVLGSYGIAMSGVKLDQVLAVVGATGRDTLSHRSVSFIAPSFTYFLFSPSFLSPSLPLSRRSPSHSLPTSHRQHHHQLHFARPCLLPP